MKRYEGDPEPVGEVGVETTRKYLNEQNITAAKIKELWTTHWPRFAPMRQRITTVRDSLRGVPQFELPTDFDVPGREKLIVKFPSKITVPLQVVNLLEETRPRLKRYSVSPTIRAQTVASDVETWINAVCDLTIPWRKLVEKLFLEGCCAVGAVPMPAHWRQAPTFLDSLDEKNYKRLPASKQRDYTRDDETDGYTRVDKDGEPLPKKRYFRDARNRPDDDEWYREPGRKFRENRKATRKAWEDERRHWLARRLPFVVRVESAMDCVPFFGEEDELIGLLVRTSFTSEDLIYQDLIWDKSSAVIRDESEETVEPKGDTLYEWWFYNEAQEPCVAYSVNLSDTKRQRDGQDVDAVINLRDEYGLSRLPWQWSWGLRLDTGSVVERAIPYNWPVLPVLTSMEALATSVLIHTYSQAFGGWAVDVNAELATRNPDIVMDGNKPRKFKFNPLTITMLPGRPIPLVHPGVGGNASELMSMFRAESQAMAPSAAVFGGSGATSGHDRALSRQYLETAMDQARDGALKAYEFLGEVLLEEACGLIEQLEDGDSIPVYENTPIQQLNKSGARAADPKTVKYRNIIELKPDWVGPIYDLEAYYPKSVAENLPQLEQLANHYQGGMVTWREYREKGHGDESPEQTLIEVWIDQYLRTDAGRAEISKLAEQMLKGDFDAEKQALIEQGQLLPDGTPVDMLAEGAPPPVMGGEPGPPSPGGAPPMAPEVAGGPPNGPPPEQGLIQTRLPGDARAVLGGIISGGLGMGPQTRLAQSMADVASAKP